jgi:hypothetical protein
VVVRPSARTSFPFYKLQVGEVALWEASHGRKGRHMRRRLTAAICLFAGVALALGLTALTLDRSPLRAEAGGITFPRDHGPFLNGSELTITRAEALFGRHIIRPSHGLANDASLRHVFFERIPGDPNESPMPLRADVVQVALDYQSGVLITVELVSGTQSLFDLDPASQYQLMVPDTPGAQTTTVHGAPAMTIPRDSSGPGVVDVTMQGERVVIGGDYSPFEVSTLLEIAQTLS